MPPKYTYRHYYQAHSFGSTSRIFIVPDQVYEDQRAFDGKSFPAFDRRTGIGYRVQLRGEDYGLNTAGTGDMVVRPMRRT